MSTIIRWNPLREMAEMQSAMNRLFDDTWRTVWPIVETNAILPLDVYEGNEGYTVLATLPGVEQDHIDITLHQNALTISVDLPQPKLEEGQQALIVERPTGKLTRTINLPRPVYADHVEAVYANGVLTLTVPISPDAQPKRIAVNNHGHMLQSKN